MKTRRFLEVKCEIRPEAPRKDGVSPDAKDESRSPQTVQR